MLDVFLKSLLGLLFLGSNAFAEYTPAEQALYDLNGKLGLAQVLDVPAKNYQIIGENFSAFELEHGAELKSNSSLSRKFNKSKRIAAIQAEFKSCLKRFGVESSLGRRILAAAFSIDSDAFDCGPEERTVSGMLEDMDGVITASTQMAFRRQMSQNIKRNMATSMASMDYLISEDPDVDPKEWASRVAKKALDKVCAEKSCSDDEYIQLRRSVMRQVRKDYKSGKRPLTPSQVASRMESDVEDINEALTENIYVVDTPEKASGRNRSYRKKRERGKELAAEQHQKYLTRYWEKTSSGYGLLLHTDEMKDKLGETREFDASDLKKKKHQNIYTIDAKSHGTDFSSSDVTSAKASYLGEMDEILKEDRESLNALKEGISPEDLEENLKDSIRNYPLAAAQSLLENPNSANEICRLINEIEDSEESSRKVSGIRKLTLSISGGVLIVAGGISSFTGFGASWGVPLMIAGGALTATEVGFGAYEYIGARAELEKLVKAQLSGSSDSLSLQNEQALRDQASSAAWDVGINLGLSATGVGLLVKKSADVAALTGTAALGEKGVRRLKAFESSGDLKRMQNRLPEKEYADFAAKIIHLPPGDAIEVMNEIRKLNQSGAKAADYRNLNKAHRQRYE